MDPYAYGLPSGYTNIYGNPDNTLPKAVNKSPVQTPKKPKAKTKLPRKKTKSKK